MSKYLEYFNGAFDSTVADKMKPENKPYVAYSKIDGVAYTVISEPVVGPADNEIWYTSNDGNIVTPYKTDVFGANIVSNTCEDGKGIIKFDSDVTSIGNDAFQNRSTLTSVNIPNSVTSIGNYTFYGCSSLTSPVYNAHCFAYMHPSYSGAYTIPEGIKQIAGGAFYDCSSLTSIVIPDSVTSIESTAFYNCTSLAPITIPNSVTTIGYHAFYCCTSLTSITIPNSVTNIGDNAFYGCSSLGSITFEATTPPTIANNSLYNVTAVYVPSESVDVYKTADNWSYYADKIKPIQ